MREPVSREPSLRVHASDLRGPGADLNVGVPCHDVGAPDQNAGATNLKVRGTDETLALEKRGCPAGYSCQSGKCYQYTCSSSGWCSLSPTSLTC